MTDASSNRAAHYCLAPGGWVECSEEMCQRHPACVEKRNAIPNSAARGAYPDIPTPEEQFPNTRAGTYPGHATRNRVLCPACGAMWEPGDWVERNGECNHVHVVRGAE